LANPSAVRIARKSLKQQLNLQLPLNLFQILFREHSLIPLLLSSLALGALAGSLLQDLPGLINPQQVSKERPIRSIT
jgi:hypothetical protein